jgi:hypothetical protein
MWHDLALVGLGGIIVFVIIAVAYYRAAKKIRW